MKCLCSLELDGQPAYCIKISKLIHKRECLVFTGVNTSCEHIDISIEDTQNRKTKMQATQYMDGIEFRQCVVWPDPINWMTPIDCITYAVLCAGIFPPFIV